MLNKINNWLHTGNKCKISWILKINAQLARCQKMHN